MKVSDYIVAFLAEKGVTDAFGYPGGMVTHLMDSFSKYQGSIRAHVTYHEQGASFCACGWAQVKHLPGVAYATSGPGATNLITGIANAFFDSTPCLFLTGQVNTYEAKGACSARQKGFQETDIVSIVAPVTKYAVQVNRKEEIRYQLEKAFAIAVSGRPGPVLLDLPMDVQRQDIDPAQLLAYVPEGPPAYDAAHIEGTLKEALAKAKRPCLVVGAGIKAAGAVETFRRATEKLPLPILSSMIAVDVPAPESGRFYGFIGAYGDRRANFILSKSDLIISVGSRLDCRQTGSDPDIFAPQAALIRFDIDEAELSNRIKAKELQFLADIPTVLSVLAQAAKGMDFSGWLSVCETLREKLRGAEPQNRPQQVLEAISDRLPDRAVITTDVGQNQVWMSQYFRPKAGQTMLYSGGHGAMGYALPAAIGAHYASGLPVYAFMGDGGLQMNIQELQLLAREHLPIAVVLLNNASLGMIRHFQEMYFDANFVQTAPAGGYVPPDFRKVATAYGLAYHALTSPEEIRARDFRVEGPTFYEVSLTDFTYVFPKLAIHKPLQDQEPPLDRALYDELMAL